MTDVAPNLGKGSVEDEWKVELKAMMQSEMKMMMQGLSQALSGIQKEINVIWKGEVDDSMKGKTKAGSAGGDGSSSTLGEGEMANTLEMLLMPGDDLFLTKEEIPKLAFVASAALVPGVMMMVASASPTVLAMMSLSLSASLVVMVSTYPSTWSTYMTPAETLNKSMVVKIPGIVHSPVQPIPVFSGAEGEDMHLWLSKAKLHRAQSGWNKTTLLAQTTAALKGAASTWLHTAPPKVMFRFVRFEEELCKSFSPLTCMELLKDYSMCLQEKGEQVCHYYFCLLLLGNQVGLLNEDFLVSHFHEGLCPDVHKGVEALPNSTTMDKLLERVVEYKAHLCASAPKAGNLMVVVCTMGKQ